MTVMQETMSGELHAVQGGRRFEDLVGLSDAELEKIFQASKGPALESLAGYEWRGFNTPAWTRALGIQKFIKGFFQVGGRFGGYNLRVRQNGWEGPWELSDPARPAPFGFFSVCRDERPGSAHPEAALLNYGESRRNRWYRPDDVSMKVLRDYVVQPDPGNPDVLLGKAYLSFGLFRVYSNFFVLERLRLAVLFRESATG